MLIFGDPDCNLVMVTEPQFGKEKRNKVIQPPGNWRLW